MSNQVVLVVIFAIVVLVILRKSMCATIPPLCALGADSNMPPNIKKVCLALEKSDQLREILESHINKEAPVTKCKDCLDKYGKPKDIDHVFLRLGRRR